MADAAAAAGTAGTEAEFDVWVSASLAALGCTDEAIAEYVDSIVKMPAAESDDEEKRESILEFLSQVTSQDVAAFTDEAIARWNRITEAKKSIKVVDDRAIEDIAKQMMEQGFEESRIAAAKNTRELTEEEKIRRAALLAQYEAEDDSDASKGSDDEDDEEEHKGPTRPISEKKARRLRKQADIADVAYTFENTNAQRVTEKMREQRETARVQNEVKFQRDKAAELAGADSKAKRKEERQKKAQKVERKGRS